MPERQRRAGRYERARNDATLTIRLPAALLAQLEALAVQEDRVFADLVRRVIQRGLATWGTGAARKGKT